MGILFSALIVCEVKLRFKKKFPFFCESLLSSSTQQYLTLPFKTLRNVGRPLLWSKFQYSTGLWGKFVCHDMACHIFSLSPKKVDFKSWRSKKLLTATWTCCSRERYLTRATVNILHLSTIVALPLVGRLMWKSFHVSLLRYATTDIIVDLSIWLNNHFLIDDGIIFHLCVFKESWSWVLEMDEMVNKENSYVISFPSLAAYIVYYAKFIYEKYEQT